MYTVQSEGGKKLAGRGEARKKSQAGSPGKGQGTLGHLFTGGQAGPTQGSRQTVAHEDKTGCREGQSLAQQPRGTYKCTHSHTCTHTCVHTHKCTHHALMHTPALTHRCIHAHSALTYVHLHMCLRAHTLILTHVQVLISGSWLQFWRLNPPRLHLSMRHFSRPPYNLPEPQAMCPTTSTW